jgi:hypothetical protein
LDPPVPLGRFRAKACGYCGNRLTVVPIEKDQVEDLRDNVVPQRIPLPVRHLLTVRYVCEGDGTLHEAWLAT